LKLSASRISRIIKKVKNSYKYYLSKLGKETIIMAQKIKVIEMIPALPIAICEAMKDGSLTMGMKTLLAGFGVGYSWSGTIISL
jgi:3-oxoacyl-[acyl-carrier-protein] synthase III